MYDPIQIITKWYVKQCLQASRRSRTTPIWDPHPIISIITIDNPGWSVGIQLTGTDLEGIAMQKIKIDRGDDDWYFCYISDNEFCGVGDMHKLSIILDHFCQLIQLEDLENADDLSNTCLSQLQRITPDTDIRLDKMIEDWYANQCEDINDVGPDRSPWQDRYGLSIDNNINKEWQVVFALKDTILEDIELNPYTNNITKSDWMQYEIKQDEYGTKCFFGSGDSSKLIMILEIFSGLTNKQGQKL